MATLYVTTKIALDDADAELIVTMLNAYAARRREEEQDAERDGDFLKASCAAMGRDDAEQMITRLNRKLLEAERAAEHAAEFAVRDYLACAA